MFSVRLLAAAVLISPLCAQVSVVRSGSFEIGGFGGVTLGAGHFGLGGGNVTYAITKYILPYAEFAYGATPANGSQSGTFSGTGNGYTITSPINLMDIHGGVHIRVPIHEKPFVPYGVIGFGTLYHREQTATATFGIGGGQTQTVPLTVPAGGNFAVNVGGGLRYYITQRFGLRVEAKVYKPTSGVIGTFGKFEGGIFIQLR